LVIDHLSTSNNHQSNIINLDNIENVYYINDGIYGSLSNIIYEKTVYLVSCLRQVYRELIPDEEKEYISAVFGPTCDSTDILSASVNLPRLEIGDCLWFHSIGA
jgi:ornithine decarboxylase